jgi:ribosomal-protein-alanine N-acetyltransferase
MLDLKNFILSSDRLTIIPVSEKYALDAFREFTPEISTYMFPKVPESIEDTLSFIRQAQKDLADEKELTVMILKKDSDEFLGCGGIHKIDTDKPEFGIWIKKSAHGQKYGREAITALKQWADQHLQYTYLVYPVDRRNISSRKIAESIGGVVEAEYQKPNLAGIILDEVEYRIYPR